MAEQRYKCLGPGRTATHGGTGIWAPVGTWMPAIAGRLVKCENGYHLCSAAQLVDWLSSEIYEAEYDGDAIVLGGKTVVRRARLTRQLAWDTTTARRFAADCTVRVLHLYEAMYSEDGWRRQVITAASASGVARDAAYVAARAAANVAAANAAWTAERAWQTTRLLDYLYNRIPEATP